MPGTIPDAPLLGNIAGGFAPLVSGMPYNPMTGMEGMPLFGGGGMTGMMANIFLGPQLQKMMGQYGMMPLGLGHDQNVFDVMRNQAFTQRHRGIMQDAAEQERGNFMRTFRGMAAMTGTPWGAEQRHAARSLADLAVGASPIMAEMAPELLDQLGGMRGSSTVMAARMSLGSRYAIDPLTGRMGMSQDSVQSMNKQIYRDLFENGDLRAMKGITAGQVGGLYDELGRRGMLATGGTPREMARIAATEMQQMAPDTLAKIAQQQNVVYGGDPSKLTGADLDKLRLDPAVADKIRSINTEQIKKSIKSYTDVIAAMRDIFGDMGRPNAPVQELLQHLEAMTQGAVGRIDPGRLNMMVRQTHEMARMSGMGLDQAMGIQQHAASRLQAMGLDPIHAVNVAQGTMGWSSAYRAQGGAATAAWGRFNADQMTQLDTNLRASAAGSEQSNRMAVLMRIRQSTGGFERGSEAERMAQAIMAGQTEYMDPTGKAQSLAMSGEQFQNVIMGAKGVGGRALGITEGQLTSMMGQKTVNEQFIERWNTGDIARRQQSTESQGWVAGRLQESIRERLVGAGMKEDDAVKASTDMANRAASRIMGMSHRQFADDRTRADTMGRIVQEELAGTTAGAFLAGKGLDTREFHQQSADQFYGYWTQSILRDNRMRGFRNAQNMHAAMNEQTMRQGTQNVTQGRFNAEMADVLSPLGRGSVLQRAVQALQDAKAGDDLPKLIASTLGVSQNDVQGGIQTSLLRVRDQQTALQKLYDAYQSAPDSASKERIRNQIEDKKRLLSESVRDTVDVAAKRGIYVGEGTLTGTETKAAAESILDMQAGTKETEGITGRKTRGRMTKEQQDAMRGKLRDFWYSDSGALARDQVNAAMDESGEVASRAIMDRRLIGRLGPEAIKRYQQIESSQQGLRQIALNYARGDMARLMHGDLDIDRTTDTGAKKYQAIMDEVDKLRGGINEGVAFFGKGIGKEGRQWGADDKVTAWQILGYSGDPTAAARGKLTDKQRQELEGMEASVRVAKNLDSTDEDKLRDYKNRLGGEGGIAERAKGFSMTPEEYVKAIQRTGGKKAALTGKMKDMTQSQLDAATAGVNEFVKSQTEAKAVAKKAGARDLDSAVNSLQAIDSLEARADTYQRTAAMGSGGLAAEMIKAYGGDATTAGEMASRLSTSIQSRDQQGFARSVIGGMAYLKDISKAKGGFGTMMEDYRKAVGMEAEGDRTKALETMRAKYGIEKGAEWEQAQKMLGVQKYMEKVGAGKFTGESDHDLKLMEKAVGKMGTSEMEIAKKMQQEPVKVVMEGHFTIDQKNKTMSTTDAKGTATGIGG